LLASEMKPDKLLRTALKEDEQEKDVSDTYDTFLRYPHFPMLTSEEVVKTAVRIGVREGIFGVRTGDRMYINEELPYWAFEAGAVLVRKEIAVREPGVEPRPMSEEKGEPTLAPTPGPVVTSPVPGAGEPREIMLRAKVPLDKLSDFVRGVVNPLRGDGAEVELEVSVRAHSESGIRQTTLDQKVKETLSQIGAEVVEMSEG